MTKIQASKQKNQNFGKAVSPTTRRQFPNTDLPGDVSAVINGCKFSILHNDMCYHLELLHNLYFPNNQFAMLQNYGR